MGSVMTVNDARLEAALQSNSPDRNEREVSA